VPRRRLHREADRLEAADEFADVLSHPIVSTTVDESQLPRQASKPGDQRATLLALRSDLRGLLARAAGDPPVPQRARRACT
jgi:hypothetical protein